MKRSRIFRNRQAGYTFIELLVVIMLASLMMLIGVPNMVGIAERYRLVGAANELAMEVSRARLQAIAQNASVQLNGTSSSFHREIDPGGQGFSLVPGSEITLPRGVTLSASPGLPLVFDRKGLAAQATTFSVMSGAGTKTVSVNLIGRVTVS